MCEIPSAASAGFLCFFIALFFFNSEQYRYRIMQMFGTICSFVPVLYKGPPRGAFPCTERARVLSPSGDSLPSCTIPKSRVFYYV